jgi:hypothetical protein
MLLENENMIFEHTSCMPHHFSCKICATQFLIHNLCQNIPYTPFMPQYPHTPFMPQYPHTPFMPQYPHTQFMPQYPYTFMPQHLNGV